MTACCWCQRQHEGGPENCLTGVLLVCGGRTWGAILPDATEEQVVVAMEQRARTWSVLNNLAEKRMEVLAVRHGGAKGADSLAGEWANRHGYVVQVFPADWNKHGKAAGPIRNQEMIDAFDPARPGTSKVVCVVAFPGRTGTADLVERAKKAGIKVWEVR